MFTTACFLLWSGFGLAQKPVDAPPDIKFGKLTPDQFINRSADSTAEAVVLYEAGDVSFKVNVDASWIIFSHYIRILIRRKSAYGRATVQLPVRRGVGTLNEKMDELEGYTYNLVDGHVLTDQLDIKSAHFTEKATESYWIEKFTMPNVREGSIIDYKYTLRTPYNIDRNPRTWRFQRDIPVDWSQYRIVLPGNSYKLLLSGSLKLTIDEAKAVKISLIPGQRQSDAEEHFCAIKNVPAFQHESYTSNEDDYISKIDFEPPNYLNNVANVEFAYSWEGIDKRLQTNIDFSDRLTPSNWLRKQAERLFPSQGDMLSRAILVYNFVRHTMTWNQEFSIWGLDAKQLLTSKKGDTGDINLFLIALLRAANIEAYPVILSTRLHGSIVEEHALFRKFNCVIALVQLDGKEILLDATDPYIKPGMLPFHCLNGVGRLINPPNSRFVSLVPTERLSEVTTGQFTLNESGELMGTMSNSYGGYGAWINYKLVASAGQANYVEAIHKVHNDWQVEDVKFTDTNQSEESFGVNYKLIISDACTKAGDRLYFKPMLTEAYQENPFKESFRRYPIDFTTPIDQAFTATYVLPNDFQVEALPKPVSIALPGNSGRFLYQVSIDTNQLRVNSRFILRKPIYNPNEYPALRELFIQIVAKHKESVVLKQRISEKK
ncbi:transglutaminase domain-containing protein [Spirosoma foliorum]|uniref:Transglutaminase n=1 Tax=Spirosoma foliorum TaxID=2710596 RepID=A0A7G5GNM8_9BACT|nr:DUF3857 domain-containing protein [Spirosoma foliorum]QMW00470.1 transglutaminase [Spirosoma foliorum]